MCLIVEAPNKVEKVRSPWSPSLPVQQAIQEFVQSKWDMVAELALQRLSRTKINEQVRKEPKFDGYGLSYVSIGYIKRVLKGRLDLKTYEPRAMNKRHEGGEKQ